MKTVITKEELKKPKWWFLPKEEREKAFGMIVFSFIICVGIFIVAVFKNGLNTTLNELPKFIQDPIVVVIGIGVLVFETIGKLLSYITPMGLGIIVIIGLLLHINEKLDNR